MKNVFALSLSLLMTVATSATAQVIPPTDDSSKPGIGRSQTFILRQISSIGVDTLGSEDAILPGARHEIKALYQPTFYCPPHLFCAAVMPPPAREVTVVLRHRELANTSAKALVLNTCRRTIEGAQPESKVLIKGKVTETKDGRRITVRSIESCSAGSAPE
jgi:hypothetical protein